VVSWDPAQYLRFGDERLRPALDLLARIPLDSPELVCDLGCGPGTVTSLLRERWPDASITGVDSSAAMLEKARASGADIEWVEADLSTWTPVRPADLVFSNAALHWLDDHDQLFPRLIDSLSPGGVLAVQMPSNFSAPTHTAIADVVESGPWRERLAPHLRIGPVHDAATYYGLLRPCATRVDIWETTYLHVLEGEDPVVEWTRGSALRPVLDRLDAEEAEAFLGRYRERIRRAYPVEPDGKTILPFRRLFVVALRR
jgi:trans-aconitate 2-methyltransferase